MAAENKPLGFDAVAGEGEGGDFTVEFTMADNPDEAPPAIEHDKRGASEEIGLLDRSAKEEKQRAVMSDEEKKNKEETVMFEDGVTAIHFILTYQDTFEGKKGDEDTAERKDKRESKRNRFIENCKEAGLLFEHQDCSESPDQKTHYLKVHGTYQTLLKGAEDMLLRMPIRENNLKVVSARERFFDAIHLNDPLEPVVPRHLRRNNYFSAPFKYDRRKNFIGYDDEKNFFSSGQKGAIVYNVLLNARYGDDDDQIGLLRLLSNKTFTSGFPLHESSNKLKDGQSDSDMTDRQFLFHRWSYWTNWYKKQPLDQIRRYFGEKVGIYFTWLGFYTSWLLPASIVGLVVMLYGLSTVNNPIASNICSEDTRYDYYMCPRCDQRCDFWYLADSCIFSRLTLIFDNGATVFFAVFMAFWAVLFLEFWKRRQFFLQYDWDMLGFEDSEQRARPQFEQKIKTYIRRCKTEDEKKKFSVHNPVLDKTEYIQPLRWFYPKLASTFAILITMVAVVVAIVFAVILYRLAVAGLIYSAVNGLPLGPSVGDIIVAVTGACIQLVAIIVMNKLYEFLAFKLTNWELHRTQTDYDDSFITKMYLFQFVNFYSSLFYIAFFKGNLTGNPGGYSRISGLRVDECATYGCLLELTIQLFIIMVGKQILNNVQELAIPYVKRFINCIKHKKGDEADIYARWEQDNDLVPINQHGLFFEYLELVIQYGFITIFVAAFPLAPFFALLNNWVEIRLDAHKFVVVQRRTITERAGDIGAWYGILAVISQLAVVTNAFLIAVTAQFIPIEVFRYGGYQDGLDNSPALSGYVNWSLTSFTVDKLLDGSAFPAFSAQKLQLYQDGEIAVFSDGNDAVYVPFIDFDCLIRNVSGLPLKEFNNITGLPNNSGSYHAITVYVVLVLQCLGEFTNDTYCVYPNVSIFFIHTGQQTASGSQLRITVLLVEFAYMTMGAEEYETYVVQNKTTRDLILVSAEPSSKPTDKGICFNSNFQCRFRGYVDDGGFSADGVSVTILGVKYWQVQTARLAFVVVFEHFIFVIAAFLAYLIPDVPQSVKNEIQREKLLAYEAVYARKERAIASPPPNSDSQAVTSAI